jgi:hypothetical protein
MIHPNRNRSRLLLGCGSTALALALTVAPQGARAQAVNATPNVVQGAANIFDPAVGQTTVEVAGPTTVIDWTPTEDVNGDALTFLPVGNTLTFDASVIPDFAVLNRILPSTNGNIAVIDGNVISQLTDLSGISTPGGFVAFYSPTGILIGDNASFDVGKLLLTTLDISPADFQNFAELGGNMTLAAAPGSTARIQINPGATITATPENSFFAVVAADVQMLGTAQVNGSHAYVAGEVVNLSFSNGLFFISVPVGTAATGTVMEVDGTVGGPSSSAGTDYHMIYGVAAAQADPISMIFRGNLGFDPAQSAGVINGEIILSANYNVSGLSVDGGNIRDGGQAVFGANSATSAVRADIFVEDLTASGRLLAIGTHRTRVSALNAASSFADDLLIVGRENAELTASNGQSLTVTGNVLVSAQDYGVVSSGLQSLDLINAQGGAALIDVSGGATMDITGSAEVVADAFAGADDLNGIAGTAQGGQAQIIVTGGTLDIGNSASISARGVGTTSGNIQTGATSRGGLAQLTATQGGNVNFGLFLGVYANATGAQGSQFSPSTVSDAFGGNALVNVSDGASLTAGISLILEADATGGRSNNGGAGSVGDAGVAAVTVDGTGQIDIVNGIVLRAQGFGGDNAGGIGGLGLGGRASVVTLGGSSTFVTGGEFFANAFGSGGDGQTGGDGFGGIAGANAVLGSITIGSNAFALPDGEGGSATFGFGGNGGVGRGGNAFFQADGTLTTAASLTITGNATVSAEGYGGNGGDSDGNLVPAGRGGDGYGGQFTVPNQADPTRGSGAFLLAGGDNGTLSIGGTSSAFASGYGGFGGFGGSAFPGGRGGDAFGGLAQVGLALLGQNGSLGEGLASFGSVFVEANAFGGTGGFSIGDFPTGDGGNATGGNAFMTISAGTVTATDVTLNALGFAGDGANGGLGTGGIAAAFGSLGGSLTTGLFIARADGFGGFGGFDALAPGVGGDGLGGAAELDLQGITVQINGDATVQAEGTGGGTGDFTAGNGIGGNARFGVLGPVAGSGTVTGNTIVSANGFGGGTSNGSGAFSGDGTGGTASLQAQGGGTVSLATLQVMANGFGGQSEVLGFIGGDGTGGLADITAVGAGSQITIARNVTNTLFTDQNFGAIVSATGVGGLTDGGTGIGGTGRGGTLQLTAAQGGSIALPADPLNDTDSVGFISLVARGFGGGSNVDGGAGGTGIGGSATIEVDGGSISMGRTNFSVFAVGGNALDPQASTDGGEGIGGTRLIRVVNGGELNAELFAGGSGARGGNGRGLGDGGNATGGSNRIEINNGTLNSVGLMFVADQAFGGNGNIGGDAVAGTVAFEAINAAINFTPDAEGNFALLLGGQSVGGGGVVAGGNAIGEAVSLILQDSTVTGGIFRISPLTIGGNASGPGGIGGSARAVGATFSATGSIIDLLDNNVVSAVALGGNGGPQGTAGQGGNAESGASTVSLVNSQITITDGPFAPGNLSVSSLATGGQGDQSGSAVSGIASLLMNGGSLDADQIFVAARGIANANIAGQTGGTATGGTALIAISGNSQVNTGLIEIISNAQTSIGGTASAGTSSLQVAGGSTATVNADQINLLADAFGADPASPANAAGVFALNIGGGNVNATSFFASATGDTVVGDPPTSELVASGGSLNVSGNLTAVALDDVLIRTGGGGIIGGPRTAATTTAVSINSNQTIRIEGDSNAAGGLGGASVSLVSSDIDITDGARIAANLVEIVSLDRVNTAVLGGNTEGDGFTLTADEIARISARELSLLFPTVVVSNNFNQPALLIRDMSLTGSGSSGFEQVRIFVGEDFPSGIIRVEGTLSYISAAANDLLQITGGRIEVVTPGGIRIEQSGSVPGGVLELTAADIWVGDAETIGQLQTDRNFAGRDALLAAAATGSVDPLGYLRGREVRIDVQSSLLVRNTGDAFEGGGILVGDGGLSITGLSSTQSGGGTQLDVFAYGRRQAADGSFIVGEAFFDEVNFNRVAPGTTVYLDAAAFNDCIINTGECPQPPPPPPPESPVEPPLVINNPTIFEGPIQTGGEPPMTVEEEEERFGMDFPERPDAPLISEDPLLDDPVSSGGDASLYSGNTGVVPDGGEQ